MAIPNLKFFSWGGGISEYTLVIPNLKFFSFWGIFWSNFGHLKSEVFHWGEGGILEYTLVIPNLKFFQFGGGYFGVNFGHPKSEVFHGGGGGLSGLKFLKGAFWRIWTKIYCSARNLLVHHR